MADESLSAPAGYKRVRVTVDVLTGPAGRWAKGDMVDAPSVLADPWISAGVVEEVIDEPLAPLAPQPLPDETPPNPAPPTGETGEGETGEGE